jgi:hypothetical protein
MGSTFDYVPIQLTKAFREAQADEKFQGWLKMQEAAMGIVFPIEDAPEVRDSMFTKASLESIEAKLLELYADSVVAYATDEAVHRTMRYVYYIGETFRQAFEGIWVAVPPDEKQGGGARPAIDMPFRETFIYPMTLIGFALSRRTSEEITRVYGYAHEDYESWVSAGKPERTYRGTLREDD